MIAKLFKLSNEVEAHAKEVEYGCETLKQVLEPMAFSYNEDLPKLPETIPLSEYQLDFIAPESKLFVDTIANLKLQSIIFLTTVFLLINFHNSIITPLGTESWRSIEIDCHQISVTTNTYICRCQLHG